MEHEAGNDVKTGDVTTDESGGSRRDLFTKMGAAAAVAAVAGLAASDRAQAGNNDPLVIGQPNLGTSQTSLSGGSTISVFGGTAASASLYGSQTANGRYGVRGFNSGDLGAGVYGTNSGSGGAAVRGVNSGDNSAGVRGDNSVSGGYGVYGSHTAAGTDSAGVYGRNTGSGHGVWGSTTDATGAGVYGAHQDDGGVGVYGSHSSGSRAGTGVLGTASLGSGVVGRGSSFDLLADRSGKVGLAKSSTVNATANGTVGTIARDASGNLWYCYATNKWEQISGVGGSSTPQFTAITPIRAYDSRIVAIPQSGAFPANSDKVISIKDGRDQVTGAVDAADAIPNGAKAVAFNVTATNTTAPSFLAVVPGNVTASAVSSLNWSGPGISIANAGIVGIDASRQVRIIAGPGGSFDAIVDITGYFI